MHVDTLQTSCGFAVPVFEFKEERKALSAWAEKKGEAGVTEYQRKHNTESIDGLATGLFED